jgi:hypothetical protein
LLSCRQFDDTLGLTDTAAAMLADPRTNRNCRHRLAASLRQSALALLAGYQGSDADRLRHDPAMR